MGDGLCNSSNLSYFHHLLCTISTRSLSGFSSWWVELWASLKKHPCGQEVLRMVAEFCVLDLPDLWLSSWIIVGNVSMSSSFTWQYHSQRIIDFRTRHSPCLLGVCWLAHGRAVKISCALQQDKKKKSPLGPLTAVIFWLLLLKMTSELRKQCRGGLNYKAFLACISH